MSRIKIRAYKYSDLPDVIQLFKEAVMAINSQDYKPEQIKTWTEINPDHWRLSLEKNIAVIAELDEIIVGFADMSHKGYLDRLYVHKNYQGRWISFYLFKEFEKVAREIGLSSITTDCSITAKRPIVP